MRQFFITLLAVIIGGFVFVFLLFMVLAGIGAAAGAAMSGSDKGSVAGNTILTLDLRQGMQDHSGGESLFGDTPSSVVDTVRTLHRAKSDDKIKGLLVRTGFGMVRQEIWPGHLSRWRRDCLYWRPRRRDDGREPRWQQPLL